MSVTFPFLNVIFSPLLEYTYLVVPGTLRIVSGFPSAASTSCGVWPIPTETGSAAGGGGGGIGAIGAAAGVASGGGGGGGIAAMVRAALRQAGPLEPGPADLFVPAPLELKRLCQWRLKQSRIGTIQGTLAELKLDLRSRAVCGGIRIRRIASATSL